MHAARTQLHTAIKLWFEGSDPISIHTLASAAYEIIHEQYRHKGLKDLAFDSSVVHQSFRQKWTGLFKNPANFFKHSRYDPDATILDFDPLVIEVLLTASCTGLSRMGLLIAPEELAMTYWMFLQNTEAFPAHHHMLQVPKVQFIQQLAAKGKQVHFAEFMAAAHAGNIVPGATSVGIPPTGRRKNPHKTSKKWPSFKRPLVVKLCYGSVK